LVNIFGIHALNVPLLIQTILRRIIFVYLKTTQILTKSILMAA